MEMKMVWFIVIHSWSWMILFEEVQWMCIVDSQVHCSPGSIDHLCIGIDLAATCRIINISPWYISYIDTYQYYHRYISQHIIDTYHNISYIQYQSTYHTFKIILHIIDSNSFYISYMSYHSTYYTYKIILQNIHLRSFYISYIQCHSTYHTFRIILHIIHLMSFYI